jgi:cytochrome P450
VTVSNQLSRALPSRDPEDCLRVALSPGRRVPHAEYDQLRAERRVYRSCDKNGVVLVTGMAEAEMVLRSTSLRVGMQQGLAEDSPHVTQPTRADPPGAGEVARLRGVVREHLSASTLKGLRIPIQTKVDRLLDRMSDTSLDFMEAVAFPFPVDVMGSLFGIPAVDTPRLMALARDVSVEPGCGVDDLRRAKSAYVEMESYFRDLVATCRSRPSRDLLSELVSEAAEDQVGASALISNLLVLFWAGFETTAYFLGNALYALLSHPDELDAIRNQTIALNRAVHELLRYDPPVSVVTRMASQPVEVTGCHIAGGDRVVVSLVAANHDPAVHIESHEFNPRRSSIKHVSFGGGSHSCLGASLAVIESEAMLSTLLRRFKVLELAGDPVRRSGIGLSGFDRLPVTARALI